MHKHSTRKNSSRGLIRNDLERLKSVLAMTAKDMRGQARRALSKSYGDVKERTYDIQENLAHYVGKKPVKALGIALLSGLAVGLVAMRKKRRTKHSRH